MAITTLGERLREFQALPRDAMRYSDLQRFAQAVEMACSISLRNMQRAAVKKMLAGWEREQGGERTNHHLTMQ